MIHLVIGGIKSGKTKYALNITQSLSEKNNLQKIYVATANITDKEMEVKVLAHKAQRDYSWNNIEAPINIAEVLNNAEKKQVIMIDCISMWITNLIYENKDINKCVNQLINSLQSTQADVVIVSNEVGHSLVSTNELGRKFQNEQGLINQKLANTAQKSEFIIAGLTLNLKG